MASFNTSAANLLQFSLLSICVQCTQNDWSKTVDKFTHYEEQSAFVMPHWLRVSTHCVPASCCAWVVKTQDCDCHSDDDHVMTTGNTGGNIQSIVSDYLQLGN